MNLRALHAMAAILSFGLMLSAGGCSRGPKVDPQAEAQKAAVAARITERETLFGAEALSPDVKWFEDKLGYRITAEGTAPKPGLGTPVQLTYVGRLKDGTVFDRSARPVTFTVGRTISGLSMGLPLIGTGGKATFYIPPTLGYGTRKVAGIPPNSGLIFEVEVVKVGE